MHLLFLPQTWVHSHLQLNFDWHFHLRIAANSRDYIVLAISSCCCKQVKDGDKGADFSVLSSPHLIVRSIR